MRAGSEGLRKLRGAAAAVVRDALELTAPAAAGAEVSELPGHLYVKSPDHKLRDLPVSRFVLSMRGGKKGLIVNYRHLWHKPKRNRARASSPDFGGHR